MDQRLRRRLLPVLGRLIPCVLLLAGPGSTGPASPVDPAIGTAAVSAATSAAVRAEAGPPPRSWPLGPPRPWVVRGWEPPVSAYGPGHRGVDLAAPAGAEVRAVAAGRISFAGQVAGRGVVSINLTGTGDPALRTTYEPVDPALPAGTEVAAGQPVGTMAPGVSHCATGCLHWGLLRGGEYLDPLTLLPPALLGRAGPRLLPVTGTEPLAAEVTLPGAPPPQLIDPDRQASAHRHPSAGSRPPGPDPS